jgi:hypothetical protein
MVNGYERRFRLFRIFFLFMGKKVISIKLYNGFLRFSFDFERVDIVFRWLSAMQKWKSLCMQ